MNTKGLEIQLLGGLSVRRNGKVLPLPPSRKTRGLLAWLAMNQRQFRREYLCELLWELPDDPKGSLRWSLSKIRKLVDDDNQRRLQADRAHVRLDTSTIDIDAIRLLSLDSKALHDMPTETLIEITRVYSGHFLEGLDLTNFYEFHAWCIGKRESVSAARAEHLKELVRRLNTNPEDAIPYARALTINSPYDEDARADLIRLLVATGRRDEAEQQYHLGIRLLDELGQPSSGVLFHAWRGAPGHPAKGARAMPTTETAPLRASRRLAGREPELRSLSATLAAVRADRRAAIVLIDGPAGIGKSRFLEVLRSLGGEQGFATLSAEALEFETLRPFSLWLDALENAATAQEEIFPTTADSSREALMATLSAQVKAMAKTPLLILFDDIHWCDESSAAALGYVAASNKTQPLVIVLAGRDSELTDNSPLQKLLKQLRSSRLLTELTLAPLSDGDIEHIILDHAPGLDGRSLSRQCNGNPLMAIELARAVASGGGSASLDQMIRARMERFELPVTDLLRWASVLGQQIDLDTLSQVSGSDLDSIGEMLQQAEQQGLLAPLDQGFRFSHNLVARSIYNDISPVRQKVMHHKVAQLLEANAALNLDIAADLAHHAGLCGDTGLAARATVRAAKLCLRFFAYQDALNLFHKGSQLANRLSGAEQLRLRLELHEIRLAAAPLEDWENAASDYVTLAEQALDYGEIGHARLGYAMASYLRWSHGQWDWAREQTLQAERITRGGAEEHQILGLAEAARCLAMLERDLSKADAMLMEARSRAERRNMTIEAISATAGMLQYHAGNWDEAQESFREARTLAKTGGDRINEFQAIEYLAMVAIERGDYDRARGECGELLTLGEKLREGSEAPFSRALVGLCEYQQRDTYQALDLALTDLRYADAKHRLAYIQNRAAVLDLSRQRLQSAAGRAEEALACAGVLERTSEILMARITLAEVRRSAADLAAGDTQRRTIADMDLSRAARWAKQRAAAFLTATATP